MDIYERFSQDLTALGVTPGDTVLMHSSFRAIGGSSLDPARVFDTLFSLLGEDGTLILPTLSYESVTREHPYFDRKKTPSCVGFLSEYFRTRVPGVIRSMHPTHSCAASGRLAEYMTEGHETDLTPVGAHSAFRKITEVGGKVLLLGSPEDRITLLHGVEESIPVRYVFSEENRIRYVIDDGEGHILENYGYRHWLYEKGKHLVQKYSRILPLLSQDECRRGTVLGAPSVLFDAKAAFDKGRAKMIEEPLYFVDLPED